MDLVEQQHKGIFSVLDEACMNVGKVTDEVFLQGLNGKLAKHAHYTSRKVGNANRRPTYCLAVCCGVQVLRHLVLLAPQLREAADTDSWFCGRVVT